MSKIGKNTLNTERLKSCSLTSSKYSKNLLELLIIKSIWNTEERSTSVALASEIPDLNLPIYKMGEKQVTLSFQFQRAL